MSITDAEELLWSVGGGVSSEPELTEEFSFMDAPLDAVDTAGVGFPLLSSTDDNGFMETRIEAASRSWTCWCLEMRSLEVSDHSGVCSHLFHSSRTAETTLSQNSQCRKPKFTRHGKSIRGLCKNRMDNMVCNALEKD